MKVNKLSKPTAGQGVPALLGVPFDANSSYLRGPAGASPLIREAFLSDSSNAWSETGVDLSAPGMWEDAGDLDLSEDDSAFDVIEKAVVFIERQKECCAAPGVRAGGQCL